MTAQNTQNFAKTAYELKNLLATTIARPHP
jgi:hypothetical protein